ncbi:hypothetical protein D9543_03450 [Corynebacterium macginleyi]|uniref:Uncharacterized protein n=1 Tax=Corynebacterium macginleyi TaxID=38290 RepID=A0A3M0GPB7_9CORY|nr:hypothetical protein D9543_03450 [Corynebacterium macginleyi]
MLAVTLCGAHRVFASARRGNMVWPEYACTPISILAGFRSVTMAVRLGLDVILGGPVEKWKKVARLDRDLVLPACYSRAKA